MTEKLPTGGYKSQKEKYEAILAEIKRGAEDIAFTPQEKETFKGKSQEETEKIFKEKARELWKDFAVHGILHFDRKTKIINLLPFSDLDGRTCLGLLKLAGFNVNNVKYIEPGQFEPGRVNLDTGEKTGIEVSDDAKTAWLDHHGPEADESTCCAARYVYLALIALGFLKKEEALDKLTQFVSRVDRSKFPQEEKYFNNSGRTILGLQRFVSFENLYNFFQKGRSPIEILSDDDLAEYNLVERSNEQGGIIEASKRVLENLAKDGFIINTKFGKIVIDIGKKIPAGYQAVKASGRDGYVIYDQNLGSFFISVNNADLSGLDLGQGKNIRKNMWIKPRNDEDILKVSIREIIEKLGGQIPEKGKLNEVAKAIDSRFKEFTVTPELSRDPKTDEMRYITRELGKLALFPDSFESESGKKYKVRIKVDTAPGERRGVYILEVL